MIDHLEEILEVTTAYALNEFVTLSAYGRRFNAERIGGTTRGAEIDYPMED